ncbi:MAG: hypothetical protein ABSG68_04715 [Thermoguttaceae bacterium]
MARIYAGVLGPLAFITCLARGLVAGGGGDSLLANAWYSLLAFSALGCLIGWIAQRTVDESVGSRIAAELASQNQQQNQKVPAGTAGNK